MQNKDKIKSRETVNNFVGLVYGTCMGNCCTLCFKVIIIAVWGQRSWCSPERRRLFLQDETTLAWESGMGNNLG